MRAPLLLVPALFLGLVACGGSDKSASPPATAATPAASSGSSMTTSSSKPESDKATWKDDAAGKSCHASKVSGDLVAGVTAMAAPCTAGMKQVGAPVTGESTGSTDTMVKTIPLAAKAGHCYRVFGLAEPSVTDFDVAVMDSNGKSAGEDGTDTNDALVREKGAICFTQDDAANVNAAVANGKGKWALEIWSD